MKTKSIIWQSFLVGILSAICIFVSFNILNIKELSDFNGVYLLYGLGFVYGVVTGLFFYQKLDVPSKAVKYLLWVLVCGLSYASTIFSFLSLSGLVGRGFIVLHIIPYFIGGAIVTIGFHYIFQKLSKKQIAISILGSGVVAFIFLLGSLLPQLSVFGVWQTFITTIFGYFLYRGNKVK